MTSKGTSPARVPSSYGKPPTLAQPPHPKPPLKPPASPPRAPSLCPASFHLPSLLSPQHAANSPGAAVPWDGARTHRHSPGADPASNPLLPTSCLPQPLLCASPWQGSRCRSRCTHVSQQSPGRDPAADTSCTSQSWPSPDLNLGAAGLRVGIRWPERRHQQPLSWDRARATEVARRDDAVAFTRDMCQGLRVPRLALPTPAQGTGGLARPEEAAHRQNRPQCCRALLSLLLL